MKIARYKFVTIAIFACFVFLHAGIAIAQTDKEQEIERIYKQLIDAENKHDLPAVRELVWNSPSTLFVAKAPVGWHGTANRHDTLATLRHISPYCAVCTESELAVDIVGVVRGKKLFDDRQELCGVRFHLGAFWDRFCFGLSGLIFKPLAERLDLFLGVGREQMFDCHVKRRDEKSIGLLALITELR
jgi:hypothetical protein